MSLITTVILSIRYLNTAILITLVVFSCTLLFFKSIRYCKKTNNTSVYKPINQTANTFYGATEASTDDDDAVSSSNTVVSSELTAEAAASSQPWSAYNWMRLVMSGIQLGFLVYMASKLNESDMDTVVEGRYIDLIYMYYARIAFWVGI